MSYRTHLTAAVVKYLGKTPAARDVRAFEAVRDALGAAYPCD